MARLIIVEGLPGSGKSTTAKVIYDAIHRKGIDVQLFTEGDYNHPADFDGVAFFNDQEFCELKKRHMSDGEILDKIKIDKLDGFLIPYKKVVEEQQVIFSEQLFKEITQKDIYELPLDLHSALLVNRWGEFVDNSINDEKVVIFECCFIQNPITVTMIRDGAGKEVTKSYINQLAELIKKLSPILIYVEQDNIEKSFRKVIDERPKEWFEGFSSYYLNQGFGLKNRLSEVEGVIKVLEERSLFEREIVNELKMDKHYINNTRFDLEALTNKIDCIINQYF